MNDETQENDDIREFEKPKQRDKWDRLQIIGQLLLPVAIAGVGFYFATQDKEYQQNNLKTERVINLLDLLANKDEKPDLVALAVLNYFQQKREVNADLVDAVTSVATSSESSPKVVNESELFLEKIIESDASDATKTNAKKGLEQISNDRSARKIVNEKPANLDFANTQIATKKNSDTTASLSAMVYLQFLKDSNRELVSNIQVKLRQQNIIAPGIEGVKTVPDQTQIRYFSGGGKTDSDLLQIQGVLKGLGIKEVKMVDISRNYNNLTPKPRIYEIWVGRNDNK